jgi:peptide subunit release factor 1 (eRF1)
MWTREERRNAIYNPRAHIERNMAICDEEIKTRKLKKFLKEGANIMDFDIEYLVIRLHDLAREVEQKFGVGELSKDIRACADRLSDLNKAK